MSNKYGQIVLNSFIAIKLHQDKLLKKKPAIKLAAKKAIQERAEATGDLIGNKTAGKIIKLSKKFPKELHSQNEDEL